MRYFLTLYILFVNCAVAASQTVVKGNVVEDISGKTIAGVNVMAKDFNGKLMGFALSDEKGFFFNRNKRIP